MNSHDQLKEPKTGFRAIFRTLDAAALPEKRLGTNVLMIGAAALVVIAVAVGGLAFKLRKPAVAPQLTLETSTSPGSRPALPAASANVQPSAKNTLPTPPATHDEAQPKREDALPKREQTVVLSARPSRIYLPQPANSARVGDPVGARNSSTPSPDAPAIFLGSVPPSGSLSNLASGVSQLPRPRLLTQSALEPIVVLKKVPPVYPLVAKQSGLSGSVVVQVTVNKNGKIGDLQLISGPALFRDAAFAAVKQWVFKPARLNGQAIEQSTRIRLHFGVQ